MRISKQNNNSEVINEHEVIYSGTNSIVFMQCVPMPPAISDISDPAVKVQADITKGHPDMQKVEEKAERGCGFYDKQATLLSSSSAFFGAYGTCMAKEFLFACH